MDVRELFSLCVKQYENAVVISKVISTVVNMNVSMLYPAGLHLVSMDVMERRAS